MSKEDNNNETTIIPVGIDLGSWNSRVSTYDDSLEHGVIVHNHDGNRFTRSVVIETFQDGDGYTTSTSEISVLSLIEEQLAIMRQHEQEEETKGTTTTTTSEETITTTNILTFLKQLLGLACDSVHQPLSRLRVVMSIPYDENVPKEDRNHTRKPQFYQSCLETLFKGAATEQKSSKKGGKKSKGSTDDANSTPPSCCVGFVVEPIAICIAYNPSPKYQHLLVIDGGASGIKVSLIRQLPLRTPTTNNTTTTMAANNDGTSSLSSSPIVWSILAYEWYKEVSGPTVVSALGQFIAQQFEQKHRFPKGEVWSSKKVQKKLLKACTEQGLLTSLLDQNQQGRSPTCHVDGLYEGLDCQVTISRPRWDMISSKLANQVKSILQKVLQKCPSSSVDKVLLCGTLHAWLRPIVESMFPSSKQSGGESIVMEPPSYFDPSEAIAMGCAKQAYWNCTNNNPNVAQNVLETQCQIATSPISIGIEPKTTLQEAKNESGSGDATESTIILIPTGTPLPAFVSHQYSNDILNDSISISSLVIWQMEPTRKKLAIIEAPPSSSNVFETQPEIKLQLSTKGRLTIAVPGGGDNPIEIGMAS